MPFEFVRTDLLLMLVPIYSNIKAFDVVKDFGSMTFCVDIGPSQKSGHILSLKYAFTLGNENDKS